MNVEIANRLQQLRKNNNLSQEELAEKIGVSRQAVSKWERAEASPDTDNLILLSRLYNMSLDEILSTDSKPLGGVSLKKDSYREPAREMRPDNYTDEEIYPGRDAVHNSIPQGSPFGADIDEEEKRKSAQNVDFGDAIDRAGRAIGDIINNAGQKINEEIKKTGKDGKTFEDKLENGINKLGRGIEKAGMAIENSFDKLGQKMEEKEKNYNNNYSYSYDNSSSEKKNKKHEHKHKHKHNTQRPPATLFDKLLPFIIVSLFFISCGLGIPHWGWVLFLLIPLYYTTKEALRKRSLNMFCYPLLCAVIYFGIGMPLLDIWSGAGDLWMSTMWLLFLTIPLYYTGIAAIKKRNPLIFCYPVLCVIVYLFFGILFDNTWAGGWWFSVAWAPLGMSIPIYYIVIDHYRKKNKASKGTQSTVSSAVD